jgi:lysophosphatidate acyltransferase
LATQGKIPIVPLVISGSLHIMAKQNMRLRKGKIKVEFLDPIVTDNMSYEDRNILMEKVRQNIINHFDESYNQG